MQYKNSDMKKVIIPDKQKDDDDDLSQYLKNQKERVKVLKKVISKLNSINQSKHKK